MNFLANVKSKEELVKKFKRLAHKFHPDKGGSVELMQQLNAEYHGLKTYFSSSMYDFSDIKIGKKVYVNGTECKVTHVSEYAFIAKAINRNKSAVFDKNTGRAIGNKRYKASRF